jgi:hypothetical protein
VASQFGLYKRRVEQKETILPDIPITLLPGETKRVEVEKSAKSAWVEGVLPFGQQFGPYKLKPAGGSGVSDVFCTYASDVGDKSQFNCTMNAAW